MSTVQQKLEGIPAHDHKSTTLKNEAYKQISSKLSAIKHKLVSKQWAQQNDVNLRDVMTSKLKIFECQWRKLFKSLENSSPYFAKNYRNWLYKDTTTHLW